MAKHCFANLICRISRKHDLFDERYIRLDVTETEYDTDVKKQCRKQHVKTGSVKGVPNLFCGIFAVGGNYNLTRNN